jgi:hypothetical protein
MLSSKIHIAPSPMLFQWALLHRNPPWSIVYNTVLIR